MTEKEKIWIMLYEKILEEGVKTQLICPYCSSPLILIAYQDVDIGWVKLWQCRCKFDLDLPFSEDPDIELTVWDKDLFKKERDLLDDWEEWE